MTVYNGTSGNDNYTGANKGTQSADFYYTYRGNDSIDASGDDDFVTGVTTAAIDASDFLF